MYKTINAILLNLLMAATILMGAVSCTTVTDKEDESKVIATKDLPTYINLTIAVSNGINNITRAGEIPTAGENGDGREAGFERENAITGITLILYEDAANKGINGADELPIKFVAYYPVTRTDRDEAGTPYTTKQDEAFYTTGNQFVVKNTIDFTKSYYAIVVANTDLRGVITTGSTLADVRAYTMRSLYSGDEKSPIESCANFIMSSEQNYKLTFPTPVPSAEVGGNLLYSITEPIRIERMAARIDFWSACSNGYKTSTDNPAYTTPGYEYSVEGGTDKFVVTGIMPFNLNGGDAINGGEYLIKRLANEVSASPTITYLEDESGSNYVLDPATTTKADGSLTFFKNTLTSLGTLADITTLSANPYYKSIANLHSAVTTAGSSAGYATYTETPLTGENVIITYPMENTLWSASRMFNYATGIAIEGDYYTGGTGTPQHRIYYGYLRHQGTSSSAYPASLGSDLSSSETSTSSNCMEFGIVRNNIYRVYISKINQEGHLTINIKVKKWDKFTHATIYM